MIITFNILDKTPRPKYCMNEDGHFQVSLGYIQSL